MANSNNNNDWRSKVKSMMTDPAYAEKMASAVDTTRKVNTNLMNKSAENYPALSLTQPTQEPLDLGRVEDIKAEEVARATMPTEGEEYSGVADLATRLYAEERKASINKANKQSNTSYSMTPHGMQFSSAAADIRADEQAKSIQKIYGKVLENKTLYDAVHANANKTLLKAMEKNQAMTDDEKKKVYEESVSNQLNAIGNSIDKYLHDINAPKSEAEWILKNAVNSSVMGQMLTSARDVEGGENVYRQQAMADYGKDASWWAQGLSTAGSLIIDTLPMSGITTTIAQPVSRATMWGVNRVGGRALQNSILGKAVVGMAGGSATLGGYNAVSTLATQFNNGYFNADEVLSSTGHGLLLGGLTGGMTPWLRGVSANMGKVGKVGTMAGGLATEAGIFTASELSEMDNPYDIETIAKAFGKNVAVIGGLKVSNLPKTINEYKGWYNEGKQSNFSDSDYKVMADFAKANGYANEEAFTMNTDGTYKRSIADRVTGNRTLLEMTKLQGGREHRLAIDMFSDPNVPLSLKTKIAAKMGWQAPAPVLANGVRVEGNKAITYYTLPDGRQQVIDIKEFKRPRNARAFANEFGRTTARRNDLLQSEAFANEMASQPIILARLNEQAKRNGTSLEEETAKIDAIFQRLNDGTITKEDAAYYNSIFEGDATATDAIKETIKAEQGVDIDEVLRKEGSFTDAEDKALTAYGNALRGIIEKGNPTTERMAVASTAGVADYVVLNNLDIMQTTELMANPTKRADVDAQMRGKYAAWLKFFDGKMGEDALAERLGYNLDNTSDLQNFLAEQTYFKTKAADRIASRTVETAKAMLENGGNGVRFTEEGKVKLKGVPYAVGVSEDIVARYEAAMNGSGEPMSRIVNDALKDIIKQGETPVQPKEPIAEEAPGVEQPMSENEAITQQMVDARLAEIDTDLQGIQADGVQKMTINDQRAMVVKGRIVADTNGQVDKAKSSTEVAYMLLDENGRPMLDENGKPKIEVGVKPSNVHVEDIEPWRRVDEYKASEEQRIRENNRITDEAMRQADEQMAVEEQPVEQAKEIIEPQTTEELMELCNGDKELAIDVATDELNRAMQSKGKGATPAETMEINKRIRMYQQMLNDLSRPEQPIETPKEQVQEPQVTEDMEFVYQQGLDENHDGMEPMQTTDGRYKWVGLQRGELTANMGERDVELLDNLAKKLGVAVIPIDVADSAVNGYYRDGNIYVNTNRGAEWTMRWVAGHEMLHDVAKKSPDAYNAYKQAVLDMWGEEYVENQVKQIIEDYKASGKTIDREQALTELVNDFGGELFNSRDGLNILDNILKTESKRGNVGFVDTIKQWWEKLKEWFSGTPYYKNVEKLLKDAYSKAIANAEEFRRIQEMDKGVSSVTDAARVEGAAIDFSIKTEPQVAQRLREYAESEDGKKHGWDKGKIESIIDETEDLIDAIHNSLQGNQRYDAWADKNPTMRVDWRDGELKQTVTWSRGNVEYKYDMSADLLCINNEALEDVLASPAMVQIVRGMDALSKNGFTSDDYLRIYQVLRDKGFVVPCAGCFDAAARFKMLPSVAKNFADLVNEIVDERNADPEAFDAKIKAMANGETTIEGLPTSAKTKEAAIRIGVAGDKLTEHITSEQLMSAQGQTDMLSNLGGIFRAWQRTGAGRPKDKLLPEPYVGDINSTTTTIIGAYGERTPSYRDIYVNQGTGLRRNSHSEFRPLLAIDEIQFMRDAFAKGLTVFKYMKELDDVRLFGNMGVKFNMSFFPAFVKDGVAAGLDANGNYIASEESVGSREFAYMGEDGRTHFDGMKGWQEAQKYTNENVSLSSVVFSVPHLIKSLTDVPTPSDKSGMWGSLIPFHSTGATSAHLALQGLGRARANGVGHPFSEALYDYNKGVTNFEAVQNDRFGEGWVIVEGKKAGTAIESGHKLEFANGTHMYNANLGVHLFKDGYIFDKDIKKKDNYGSGKVNTKNVKKYMTKFYIDYNDKVRELGGDYAYKDAADYYLRELPKIGLIPRFSFEVPESIYLEMCKAANVDPKHPKLGWKGEGNAWNPIDAESYYSLFCDYGMTDPKTGKWSPHKPIGNVDENGNRVFRLPDNAVQIVKDAVDKYSARRDKEESRINGVYEEFLKRSVKDGRLSEAEAQNLLSEISTDPNGGGGKPIDAEFSIKADKELEKKSLVGVHNLTEDNLRYALNLGGLANPSTAVIDKSIMGLEGFGDISLIMPKSLVAKSTGKNAGTFAGDGYTPRFPSPDIIRQISDKGRGLIEKDFSGDDRFSKDIRSALLNYGNEFGGITNPLYYLYKSENGGADVVRFNAEKPKSAEEQQMVDKYADKNYDELTDAEKQELLNYTKASVRERMISIQNLFGKKNGLSADEIAKRVDDRLEGKDWDKEAQIELRELSHIAKMQRKDGEIDYEGTYSKAERDVLTSSDSLKFRIWLDGKAKKYGIKERVFAGFDAKGNRKYEPFTLKNISKIMTKQGGAGSEVYQSHSPFALRAKLLDKYYTLEGIKAGTSKLTKSDDYFESRQNIEDTYNALIEEIATKISSKSTEEAGAVLSDSLLEGFDYVRKKYKARFSTEMQERIKDFGNLLKESPARYFETKFERPVMFDEFVAAVVPKDINPELRKALADKGLAIEEYERGSEESRLEAVRRASDRDDVQFSVKGKRADESVLDYAKRMSEENAEPLPTANAKQSKSNLQLSATRFDLFDDAEFSISKGNRATIEGWLNKRDDLSDKERNAVIDYIDKLDSAQVQLATGKWFASGAIRLPEDMPKVEQAAKVAKKAKVDMLKYASPMELINTHADLKIKGERINPHDVKELKAARSIPNHGIEIFDVEDSKKGQQAMRKIINTHWGEDANPWCLLQGDGKGNLTKESWDYWNYYNGYPKRVAFKDGKLLAFSANNDSEDVIWWDRNDESHEYIPIIGKVPNDRYGRSALMEVHDDGQVDYSNFHIGNENKNGAYMRWDDDGELIQSGEYKDGKFTGWKKLGSFAVVYRNGESYHRSTRGGIMEYSEFTNTNNVHYTKEEKNGGAVDYRIANRGKTDRPSESISTYKGETTRYNGKEFTFIDAYGLKMYNLPADSDITSVSVDWKTNKSKVEKNGVVYELDSDGNIEKETYKIPYRSFHIVAYRRPDGNVQHIETIDGRGKRTGWVRYFYTTDGEKRNEPLDKLYDNGYPYNRKDIPSNRIEFDKKWLDIDFVDSKDLKLAKDKAVKNAEELIKSRSKAIIDEVEREVAKVGNIDAEVEQMKKRDLDALNQKYADYSIKRGGKTLEERLNSKRMQTRLNAAKELGKDYPEVDNILNNLEPSDINEVVAATLGSPDFKLRWEDKTGSKGLQKHLGLSDAEKKGFRSMISSNGYTPEEAAHQIWRGLSEEIAGKTDTSEILDLVLDYARSYTKRELREMIVNNRIDTAIDYARKQAEWDAAQEQIYLEGLTEAERNAYLANKAEQEKIANMTEKQKAKYFAELQRKQMLDAMAPEERAEYEAKEKWRKENAGAIASSFFADRRADKAAKIQALKDQINKLIRDTRAAKSEDSAKVKEIAKKMREFIEESIPTKNQDDMTRNQFEQVLKQLANATTRKQLEEPMRMIDYIGANVNRKALTRQMEDFLKKGFKGMTPKGLVKAKMVDGATSRVLGLTKSLYSAMSKKPLGSELRALQTNVRGIKAELEEYNEKNGGQYQEYVDQIDAILKKSGVDRHEEMSKYYNEILTKENTGEVLDYVGRLLPELFAIEVAKEQRKDAKMSSALNTKEDLEQLKNSLADKEEKGILSEEDKAVMDNISLYELMIDLHQRQLDIDGPGASSIASQMAAKVEQVKEYRESLSKAEKGSAVEARIKTAIKQTQAEIDELFVQRTQAQKEVNTNTEELLANLKELRDDGISKLQEWSKAKKEREKQIVTMANESFGEDARGYWSEVDRKGKGKRDFVNWMQNAKLAVMSPAMSFEYMLGAMDPRYYTNESPIYKQFIKGNEGLIKANDDYFVGLESYNQGINEAVDKFIGRTAMTNLKDYFKKGDRYATKIIPFAFEVTENKDGEIVKTLVPTEREMTRGQAAKIYAWSRMADGMAKLKAHGVTDDTMDKVKEFIGEDYMNFIDWVEDVYFPKLRREKYNPIYKQMYGISMAENEHYFPFLIYQKDVRTEQELEQPSNDKLGGGVVGNLVERKQNNARLDFTAESPDIFDMITDYGKKMEEWAAYAQVREDLKKVVNNKQFKQHCDMLGTHYYKYFLEAAQVASRLSRDMAMTQHSQSILAKAQKMFASAAISLRVSTALKQLLSAPAFMVYSLDPKFHHELLKTVEAIDVESAIKGLRELANGNKAEAKKLLLNENWVGHYNWCVENLPSFRERISRGGAGNPILEEKGFKIADDIQSLGMKPNQLVDAFTCSVGAKAIYEYTYKKFKKNYDDKTAHNMAATEATIAFNTSQQSSNPVFLAPSQVTKQFWVRGIMNYKNSPIGFWRNGMKANIDLYRATKALFGQPKFTINGEEKGFESGGRKAISKAAEAAAKSLMFNFGLNAIWNFGTIGIAGLSYKVFGNSNDDGSNPFYTDEEIKKVTNDNIGLYLVGCAIQGMPILSGLYNTAMTGYDYSPSILLSEFNHYAEQISNDGIISMASAQLLTDLLLMNTVGVDPQVWGQIYRGAQGIMADRPMRVEDFMNLIASPRSAISGVAKQKVGQYDNIEDYVNSRIESEREIGVNDKMTFGNYMAGMRRLKKSKLDGYIDEYLADKIPDYREIANKLDDTAKKEKQEQTRLLQYGLSLVGYEKEKAAKRKDKEEYDSHTKDVLTKVRKAVTVIHDIYAYGDAKSAQRIADELERRIKRGYNPDGATLDERLKGVDIYDSTGTTEQRSQDGYNTLFDRAMLGGFNKTYLGNDRLD